MNTSEFDYELPPNLIAHEPARPRDASRMMLLDRKTGGWIDSEFRRLPEFLNPSRVLVNNDSGGIWAGIGAALFRADRRRREIEVLFSRPVSEGIWEILCRPGKRVRKG